MVVKASVIFSFLGLLLIGAALFLNHPGVAISLSFYTFLSLIVLYLLRLYIHE
jgi:hypothetical protein